MEQLSHLDSPQPSLQINKLPRLCLGEGYPHPLDPLKPCYLASKWATMDSVDQSWGRDSEIMPRGHWGPQGCWGRGGWPVWSVASLWYWKVRWGWLLKRA